jgi:hypothetical protein
MVVLLPIFVKIKIKLLQFLHHNFDVVGRACLQVGNDNGPCSFKIRLELTKLCLPTSWLFLLLLSVLRKILVFLVENSNLLRLFFFLTRSFSPSLDGEMDALMT